MDSRKLDEYRTLDDKIKELSGQLKTLKEEHKTLSETILESMLKQNICSCNLVDQTVLCVKTHVSKNSINKETLKDSFIKLTETEIWKKGKNSGKLDEFADESADFIFNDRESSSKNVLKRTKLKK